MVVHKDKILRPIGRAADYRPAGLADRFAALRHRLDPDRLGQRMVPQSIRTTSEGTK